MIIQTNKINTQDVITSWGLTFTYPGAQKFPQHRIDHMARLLGNEPPKSPISGCKMCIEGAWGPSHWPSIMCESGARYHCTCDACF